jgi:hypothetical protein
MGRLLKVGCHFSGSVQQYDEYVLSPRMRSKGGAHRDSRLNEFANGCYGHLTYMEGSREKKDVLSSTQ